MQRDNHELRFAHVIGCLDQPQLHKLFAILNDVELNEDVAAALDLIDLYIACDEQERGTRK